MMGKYLLHCLNPLDLFDFFEGESVQPLYPGVLDFNYVDAFWASGTEILVTMDATPSLEEERTLRTVNVLKDPSPYYGF